MMCILYVTYKTCACSLCHLSACARARIVLYIEVCGLVFLQIGKNCDLKQKLIVYLASFLGQSLLLLIILLLLLLCMIVSIKEKP